MTDTNKLLAALLAALTAANKPTMGKKGASSGIKRNPKFKAKAKPDTTALCIAAFEAKGFKDVQPKVNVMTYKAWVAKGRRVVPGQKGTKVGPFTLFHKDQTAVITAADTTGVQQISMVAQLKLDEAAIAEYGV
mgnify:FL=1